MSTSFARLRSHLLAQPELLAGLLAAESVPELAVALERLALGPELQVSCDDLEQAVREARRENLERWLR